MKSKSLNPVHPELGSICNYGSAIEEQGFFLINKQLFQTFLEGFLQIENVKQYSQTVLFDLSDTKNKKTSTDLQIIFFCIEKNCQFS